MPRYTQKERGGLYELTDAAMAELVDSNYYNSDLAPTPLSKRDWNTYHIASLWIGMSVCLPAFALSSSLVALGLSPWLAVLNVILGNLIILIPIQLNSHAGTKYGIPFPVFSRMTFGSLGAHVPALSRAIIACGWNAIQSWVGGAALVSLISSLFPDFQNLAEARYIGFFIFLGIVCWIASSGSGAIKVLEAITAPMLVMMTVGLFLWSLMIGAGGDANGVSYSFGEIIQASTNKELVDSNGGFWFIFLAGLTGNIAFWATMALNISDFSRFAVSQRSQFRGQLYGMPLAMAVCAFVGAFFAEATSMVGITDDNGNPIFDPTEVLSRLGDNPFISFIVSFGVIIATMTTTIAANVVGPANGFSNISPKKISYAMGVLISCVLAVIYQPWNMLDSAGNYVFNWLDVYGSILAPIAAIFVADYYLVKKRNVDVMALYQGREGRYWYNSGWNIRAVMAWICGFLPPTLGSSFLNDSELFSWISANGYIIGFVVGMLVYVLLMKSESTSFISDEELRNLTDS